MGLFEDITGFDTYNSTYKSKTNKQTLNKNIFTPGKVYSDPIESYKTRQIINKLNKYDDEESQRYSIALQEKEREREEYLQKNAKSQKDVLRANFAFEKSYDNSRLNEYAEDYRKKHPATNTDLFSTIADIGINVGKSFVKTAEGITDFGQVLISDIASTVVGENDFSKFLKGAAEKDITGALFGENNEFGIKDWTKDIEKHSLSGNFTDSVAQGIGNILAFVGSAGLGTTIAGGSKAAALASSAGSSFTSSWGNTYTELKRKGIDDATARKNATINAIAETASEQFFNKIPGITSAGWGDKVAGKITDVATDFFNNKNTGKLVMRVIDGLSEGSEEVISNMIQQFGNDFLYLIDNSYDYEKANSLLADGYQVGDILKDMLKQVTSEESIEAFLSASMSSFIVNAGKGIVDNKTKNKIINAYAKDNGMSFKDAQYILTGQQEIAKQEIERDVRSKEIEKPNSKLELEEMAKDRVLNYMSAYTGNNVEAEITKQVQQEEKRLGVELTEEERKELEKTIRATYEDRVNSANRYKGFEIDEEKLNDREKELYKSFKDSKINNTQEAHNLFNLFKTLQNANETSNFKMVSNESLAKMQNLQKIDGTINGFKKGNTIYINKDGANPYQTVIGHEIGEAIKSSDKTAYDELKRLVMQVYGEGNLDDYRKVYQVKKGEISSDLTDNIEDEYINDKLGEMLESEKLVDRIANEKNVLQNILRQIKRLAKYITSSKEQKQLMKLQKTLEDKYIELYKEADFTVGSEQAAFSLEQNYKGSHQLEDTQSIINLDLNNIQNKVIDANGGLSKQDYSDLGKLKKMLNNPNENVKIYRASPVNELNNNDWVTTDKSYAQNVAQQNGGKVYTYEVKASDLYYPNDVLQLPSLHRLSTFQYVGNNEQQVQYSLSQDNMGRELSKEQQEYFKDSKVRDENGNLEVLHHQTNNDFTVFKSGFGITGFKNAHFFTNQDLKQIRKNKLDVYVNITNPLYLDNTSIQQRIVDNAIKDGYDGIINQNIGGVKGKNEYVAFNSNQIKNIDNTNPTTNEDIRYSLSTAKDYATKAEEKFGITRNFKEAAYITVNGNPLDFSNKQNGGTKGERSLDHRKISDIGVNMDDFIRQGNIRLRPEGNGLELYVMPNEDQISTIYDYVYASDGDLFIDVLKDNGDYDVASYKSGTQASKIVSDLKEYFENGKFPPKSEFADYYSISKEQRNSKQANNINIIENYEDYINSFNLPQQTTQQIEESNLPEETKQQLIEEQKTSMEERRRKLADKRFTKLIENQTYKSLNAATKTAKSYLDFNQKETREFKDKLTKLAQMPKDSLINAKNYNKLFDIISQYADKDYTFINQDIKDAQKLVRNRELIVSDDLKDQITDWGDFRKSAGLNIRKGAKSNVDTVYEEISDMYPEYLDRNITNYADQLQELSDFVKRDAHYTEHYQLSNETINQITNSVWEKLSNNALTKQEITDLQNEINERVERRTREVVQEDLLEQMGITIEDIQLGEDINSLAFQRTDPKRVNEKVFGFDIGRKINDATVNFANHQEAERTRFVNNEKDNIKELGIKARSKESAAVQKWGEKQYVNDNGELVEYNDRDLMNEFDDIETVEKIKNAANFIRQKYDTYLDLVNERLEDMGYDPIPKRQDYFMHFAELEDKLSKWGVPFSKENISAEDLPTDINGLTDQFKPGKNFFASAMQRKGIKTTYDAITGIDKYLDSVSNLIYHTETIQRYRTLSKFIRETFGQKHGLEDIESMTPEEAEQRLKDVYDNKLSKYAAWLDEQANSLAGKKGAIDRSAERFMGRRIYTGLNAVKKQVGSNMTGYNVRSAMTNFASAIQGASKTNKFAFLQGTISTIKNIIHDDGLIYKSDFLTNRFGTEQLSKKKWQKISEAGQIFMSGTDYFTANQIWRGKYYEGLNNGLTEDAAIKNADDFAARIMGDRSKGQTAEIFNSKTLGLLTQFQLEVNNQWSSMIHDNKMALQQGDGAKVAASVTFQLGQLFGLSWLFNNFMKAVTGSDVMIDPIDMLMKLFNPDDDKDLEEKATTLLGDIVNQLPMTSIFTGGRIPISEAFSGVDTGFKYITGQKDKYGNAYTLEDVKNDLIGSAAYYLFPTGYGQLKKTTQGLMMYDENLPLAGSYTKSGRLRFEADTSTLGKLQAAVFGRNASANAREYYDKGYNTLTEKQVQEAIDYGMDISTYREFSNDLKEAQRTKVETDNGTYEMYRDKNNNWYWYNVDTGVVYKTDNSLFNEKDLKETKLNPLELEKVSKTESTYGYVSNMNLPTKTKLKILNNELGKKETITDQYGFEKYQDKYGKTYWYDTKNNIVYDSKYNKSKTTLSSLTKASNTYTKNDIDSYGSLSELNYATNNPEKYLVIQQITDYNNYDSYKSEIEKIKTKYLTNDTMTNKQKDTINKQRKQAVFQYINTLPLNKYQKLMLQKQAGGYSIKGYENALHEYINKLNLSKADKQKIHKELFD